MRTLLIGLMLGAAAWAGSEEKPSLFVDKVILYDGEHKSIPLPWVRGATEVSPKTLSCAHARLSLRSWHGNDFFLFNCTYSVIGIDFTNKALLAFIDIHHYDKFNGTFVEGGYPAARYLASIKGDPKDYFKDLQPATRSTPLQSLAEVMNQLGRSKKGLGQRRFLTGRLIIATKGELMQDPLYHGLEKLPDTWSMGLSSGGETFDLTGTAYENKRYPVPTEVYAALSKTMDILWEGYEEMKAASGNDVKVAFKERIAKNAETISGELLNAVELMRSKEFHPLELFWFVNQMGDLIAAIDRILESKEGSDPGFIELIDRR